MNRTRVVKILRTGVVRLNRTGVVCMTGFYTHFNDLWESVSQYAQILKDQIELLDPNVLIFGNTIELYKDILQLDLKNLERSGTCQYIQKEGKLFISAYHPSQRTIPRNQYVNDIVQLVQKWAQNMI